MRLLWVSILINLLTANAWAGFVGPYESGNWSCPIGFGSCDTGGAPDSVTLIGPGWNFGDDTVIQTFQYPGAPADGQVTFDWVYSNPNDPAADEPFGYLVNGSFSQLIDGFIYSDSGSASFSVNEGDSFGFAIKSFGTYGDAGASVVISNFSGPLAPVPLPPAVWLLTSALGMLGWINRRKPGRNHHSTSASEPIPDAQEGRNYRF